MPETESSPPVLFSTIRTASGQAFGRATLNAPASLNALSLAMVDLLDPQLARWATDPDIVGVVLDGAGEKAFCAGGDVVGLYRSIRSTPAGEVPRDAAAFFEREYRLDYRIHRYPKPVLCWGHGIVMGGGIGLMAGASHRIVTPKTRMAMPEIGIGLYPDVGGSYVLPRLPKKAGLFLALTGATINAADALYAGLADVALAPEHRSAVIEAITTARWQGNPAADGAQLTRLLETLAVGVALPASPLRTHAERIATTLEGDQLERIAPHLAALSLSDDPWLSQAGLAFWNGSPTSATLGFEMQRRAEGLSLADVFRLEWNASVGCCRHHDFAEGVRALLVDKDKNPRWQPATLAEVSPALIEAHLQSPTPGPHPLADLV